MNDGVEEGYSGEVFGFGGLSDEDSASDEWIGCTPKDSD